jgi:hypothetical protein
MRRSPAIPIDLLTFMRTGRFDCIEPGQTQEYVLHNFPDPDGFDARDLAPAGSGRFTIWRYGNIELHFEGDRLYLIYSDYIDTLTGGEALAVAPWILGDPARRSLSEVMRALTRERIDFSKRTGRIDDIQLVLASGVILHFAALELPRGCVDPDLLQVSAFALQRP